jgi:phosphonate transport system ATP-binding protein
MSANLPVIEARGAHICAGASVLLHDVNLTIFEGERIAIVGHNGAGKSSLLRAITGFSAVSQGSLRVCETEMSSPLERSALRLLRSRIAQVHQGLNLVGRLSAIDNVLIGGAARATSMLTWLRRWPAHETDAAQAALARVGMARAAARRTDSLSGGERQKVAIARALHQQAPVLLADEPTASLDADAADEIVELINALVAERKSTLLCVVHDLERVSQLADRVIVLRKGGVIADAPATRYSASELRGMLR